MRDVDEAVLGFLEGDEEAYARIVRRWESKVYNMAWRYLGNREDAQDAVQDTFLSVFKSMRTLRDPRSFPTWLYRVTLNHCRSRWRSQHPELSLEDPIPGKEGEEAGLPSVLPAATDTGEKIETRDLVRKALMGISENHRMAIVLKEYLGLSLEEVAQVMDCPLSTAKSRLYHGLRGVQRNLRRLGIQWSGC